VAWQKLAEGIAEVLHKGSAVLVEGRLHSRTWESSDGQRHSVIEIHAQRFQMLSKTDGEREYTPPPPEREAFDEPEADEDMPF
jgi:single-strand DNA-binding protein